MKSAAGSPSGARRSGCRARWLSARLLGPEHQCRRSEREIFRCPSAPRMSLKVTSTVTNASADNRHSERSEESLTLPTPSHFSLRQRAVFVSRVFRTKLQICTRIFKKAQPSGCPVGIPPAASRWRAEIGSAVSARSPYPGVQRVRPAPTGRNTLAQLNGLGDRGGEHRAFVPHACFCWSGFPPPRE